MQTVPETDGLNSAADSIFHRGKFRRSLSNILSDRTDGIKILRKNTRLELGTRMVPLPPPAAREEETLRLENSSTRPSCPTFEARNPLSVPIKYSSDENTLAAIQVHARCYIRDM